MRAKSAVDAQEANEAMTRPETHESRSHADERGFALILALLALMLLTFLGLTLATTTSTELQIAGNYRAAQQAFYNAELGLEVGKVLLFNVQDPQLLLPYPRPNAWDPASGPVNPPVPRFAGATRNFENSACDQRGSGVGYGAVLDSGTRPTPYENIAAIYNVPIGPTLPALPRTVQGAFTVWIRRPLITLADGTVRDDPDNRRVVLVAEGVAPSATATNRAVRLLEEQVNVVDPCKDPGPQGSDTGRSGCR
jgi:hypothetical protein